MSFDAIATPWGFASVLTVSLGIIVIVIILVTKIKSVKVGDASLTTNADGTPALCTVNGTPHTQCIHGKDIVILLKKQAEMFDAVRGVICSVMPEQMKVAEGRGIDIRGVMQRKFLKMLSGALGGKDVENLVEHSEYKLYRMCLDILYNELLDRVRILFRENHYADRTESAFRDYVANKTAELNQHASDLLNDLYHGSLVTRVMLYDGNQEIKGSIDTIFSDIFWNAREIAIKAASDSEELKAEFEALFEQLF